MKKLALILLAALCFAACKKEDPAKWLDGTSWRYSMTDGSHKVNVSLALYKGGDLEIHDENSWYWNDIWRYQIKSYTYDGDKSGTIELHGINYYSHDGTASFSLNYDQKKMSLSTPNGYYTLERTK